MPFFFSTSYKFQSTLPLRGATLLQPLPEPVRPHFNPRSPYGERRRPGKTKQADRHFNPRSPYGERRRNVI